MGTPNKLYAVLTVGRPPKGAKLEKDTLMASRVGVDFACMDVALEKETFRLYVWPDRNWSLEWCPRRWKDADEAAEGLWVKVAEGKGKVLNG